MNQKEKIILSLQKIIIILVMVAASTFFCGISGIKSSKRAKKAKAIYWSKTCTFKVHTGNDSQFGFLMKNEKSGGWYYQKWGRHINTSETYMPGTGGSATIKNAGMDGSYRLYTVSFDSLNVYYVTPYIGVASGGLQGFYQNTASLPTFGGDQGTCTYNTSGRKWVSESGAIHSTKDETHSQYIRIYTGVAFKNTDIWFQYKSMSYQGWFTNISNTSANIRTWGMWQYSGGVQKAQPINIQTPAIHAGSAAAVNDKAGYHYNGQGYTAKGYSYRKWDYSYASSGFYANGTTVDAPEWRDYSWAFRTSNWPMVWRFVAKSTANSVTVHFRNYDGAGHEKAETYTYGKSGQHFGQSGGIPTTLTGHQFTGWRITTNGQIYPKSCGVRDWWIAQFAHGTQIYMDAQWATNTITIRYNKGLGTSETSSATYTYKTGQSLAGALWSNTGYRLTGWKLRSNSERYSLGQGISTSWLAGFSNGSTLDMDAVWVNNVVHVKFNKNDGSGSTHTENYTYGKTGLYFGMNLSGSSAHWNEWKKSGYTLSGWKDSSGKSYSLESAVTNDWIGAYANDTTVTLYAQWVANTITIRYSKGLGTSTVRSTTYTYGKSGQTIAAAFSNTGYRFTGWKLRSNGTSYSAGQSVSDSWIAGFANGTILDMDAVWVNNVIYVKFNRNDGSGATHQETYTYGKTGQFFGDTLTGAYAHWNAWMRSGYRFTSWKASNGTTYSLENTVLDKWIGSFANASTIVLNAQWAMNQSTLYIDPNGGTWSGQTTKQTYVRNAGSTLSVPDAVGTTYTTKFDPNGGTISGSTAVKSMTSSRTFTSWSYSSGSVSAGNFAGKVFTFAMANDGYGTLTAQYTLGAVTTPSATKPGYKFVGWAKKESPDDFIQNDVVLHPTENITYYAAYADTNQEGYLIVDPNGGTWNGKSKLQNIKGSAGDKNTINDAVGPEIYVGLSTYWVGAYYANGQLIGYPSHAEISWKYDNGSTIILTRPWLTDSSGYFILNNLKFNKWIERTEGTKAAGSFNASSKVFSFGTNSYGQTALIANYSGISITLPNATASGYTLLGWTTGSVTNGPSRITDLYSVGQNVYVTTNQYFRPVWEPMNETPPTPPTPIAPTTQLLTICPSTNVYSKGIWRGTTEETNYWGNGGEEIHIDNPISKTSYSVVFDAMGGVINGETKDEQLLSKKFDHWEFKDLDGNVLDTITGARYSNDISSWYWYINTPAGNYITKSRFSGSPENVYTNNFIFKSMPTPIYDERRDRTFMYAYYSNPTATTPTPTKSGYTFNGWSTDEKATSGAISNNKTITISSNVTYYATWKPNSTSTKTPQSTLTIDCNGGTCSTNATFKNNISFMQNQGTKVNIPALSDKTNVKVTYYNVSNGEYSEQKTRSFTGWTLTHSSTPAGTWSGSNSGTKSGTFTFGSNDGGVSKLTATFQSATFTLPTPAWSGRKFVGWGDSADAKTGLPGGTQVMLEANKGYYAIWEMYQSTITVDPNGGTWEGSSAKQAFTQNAGTTKSIKEPTGATVNIIFDAIGGSVSSQEKYIYSATRPFSSWSYTAGNPSAGTWASASNTFTFSTGQNGAGTLTASYGNVSTTMPTPVRTGYTFKGWSTSATATSGSAAGTSVTRDSDITYYAIWVHNSVTLYVDPNGGTWEGSTVKQVFTRDIAGTRSIENPTGKTVSITFDAKGGTVSSQSKYVYSKARPFTSWTYTAGSPSAGIWSSSTKVFTFAGTQSGSGTLTAQYGSISTTMPATTRTGYTFKGWSTSETATSGSAAGTSVTRDSDITYYAIWTINSTTLYINPNGGSYQGKTGTTTIKGNYGTNTLIETPTGATVKVTYNTMGGSEVEDMTNEYKFSSWTSSGVNGGNYLASEKTFYFNNVTNGGSTTLTASYTAPTFVLPKTARDGYTFNGWSTSATAVGGTASGTTVSSTSDTTYYATWTVNKYTLTVNPNGGTWVTPDGSKVTTIQNYTKNYEESLNINDPTGKNITVTYNGNGGTPGEYEVVEKKDSNGQISYDEVYKTKTSDTQTVKGTWSYTSGSPDAGQWKPDFKQFTFGKKDSDSDTTVFANGGKGTLTASYVNASFQLPTAIKNGYAFNGWAESASATTGLQEGTTVNVSVNKTYYATWVINKTTLTVNPNGGKWNGSYAVQNFTKGYHETQSVPDPSAATVVATFDGNGGTANVSSISNTANFIDWKVTNKILAQSEEETIEDPGGEWSKSKKVFTFSGYHGGKTTMTASYNNISVILPGVKVRQNYTFKGWSLDKTANKGIAAGTTVFINKNTTYYATWVLNTSTLTIDPNGGSLNGDPNPHNYTKTSGEKQYVNAATGNTYTVKFDGNGGSASSASIRGTQSFDGWKYVAGDPGAGTWDGKNKFTFGSNAGGTGTLYAQFSNPKAKFPYATRDGYIFLGWAENTYATEAKYQANITYEFFENKTLYAVWGRTGPLTVNPTINGTWRGTSNTTIISGMPNENAIIEDPEGKTITIHCEGNGGNVYMEDATGELRFNTWTYTPGSTSVGTWNGSSKTFTFASAAAGTGMLTASYKNANVFVMGASRKGYTFLGWSTDKNATTGTYKENSNISTASNMTVYAIWRINNSTLTVKPNGGTWNGTTADTPVKQNYGTTKGIENATGATVYAWYNAMGGTAKYTSNHAVRDFTGWTFEAGNPTAGNWNATNKVFTFGEYSGGTASLTATWANVTFTFPTVTKTGYTFRGWNTSSTGKGGKAAGESFSRASNITYYATWEANKYKISIVNDPEKDKTPGITKDVVYDSATGAVTVPKKTVTVTYYNNDGTTTNKVVTLTATFEGYYSSAYANGIAYGTQIFDKNGNPTSAYSTWKVADNMTVYAKWSYQSTTTLTVTRTGYTFQNWKYTGTYNKDQLVKNNVSITPHLDAVLNAQWTANNYVITTVPDPEKNKTPDGTSTTLKVTYNSNTPNITVPKKTVTVTYYNNDGTTTNKVVTLAATFEGYYSSVYANGIAYGTQIFDKNGTPTSAYSTWKVTDNMTVYAKWSYQSTTTLTVTRTGYTFQNWKYTGTYNKNQLVKNNVSITPHLDAVLNAQWTANNYVITTVPDPEKNKTPDGTSTTLKVTYDSNTPNVTVPKKTVTVTYYNNDGTTTNKVVTLAATFEGYYSSVYANGIAHGTQIFDKNGTPTSAYSTWKVADNMTVYAKWSYATDITPTPTKTGYTFQNWKYTGTYNKNQLVKNNVSITPHLDAVLNAQWTANNYVITTVPDPEKNKTPDGTSKVTYDSNTPNITVPKKTVKVTYNYNNDTTKTKTVALNATFLGYYDAVYSNGIAYGNQVFDGNGAPTANYKIWKVPGNITLYAKWSYANDITPIPTKTGYTFYNWKYTFGNDKGSYVNGGVTIAPHFDAGLEAQYTANHYLIAYHPNGGSGNMASTPAIYDQSVQLRPNTFNKKYHTFFGWALSSTGTKKYNDKETVMNLATTGVAILYANWAENSYTVRFDANGGTGTAPDQNVTVSSNVTFPDTFTNPRPSKFVGWSIRNNVMRGGYASNGTISAKTVMDQFDYYANGSVYTLYAIWDYAPKISGGDLTYTREAAEDGFITTNEILSHFTFTDAEDDDRTLEAYIPTYREEDFTSGVTSVTETIVVRDSAGNETSVQITIYIDDTYDSEETIKTTRFISGKYYKNTVNENSVWKKDENHKDRIKNLFNDITTDEQAEAATASLSDEDALSGVAAYASEPETKLTFKLSEAEVEKARAYIYQNSYTAADGTVTDYSGASTTSGFGKTKSTNGLKEFYRLFINPNVK